MSFLTERYFQILERHQLYSALNSKSALSAFVESHVICVWSYNALLRSLQRDIFAQSLPINSDPQKEAIRILSEIVLEEEVFEFEGGQYANHFEFYLDAMSDLGANTSTILTFLDLLNSGFLPPKAAAHAGFSLQVVQYASEVFSILASSLHRRAGAFFYEGEYFLPNHFLCHLHQLTQHFPVSTLVAYFEKHIEGLKHPGYSAAGRLVEIVTHGEENAVREVEIVGERLMSARILLWNSIFEKIQNDFQDSDSCPRSKRPSYLALVT